MATLTNCPVSSGVRVTSRPAASQRVLAAPITVAPQALASSSRVVASTSFSLPPRTHRRRISCRAAAGEVKEDVKASGEEPAADWIPVCLPEELPKGVRKEVELDGAQVLLFWYRNQIYAIEARSPAEGAYSEGFIKAKFTQDYCIECPSTASLYSLKDGSVVSWYPNNPVLGGLTPKSRNLEIYPVKLAQEAIYVDVKGAQFGRRNTADRGGAGTSIDNNNVFTVQPTVYFEGMDPAKEAASLYMEKTGGQKEGLNPAVAIATTAGVGAFAVAGTAVCIYLENLALLAVFWAIFGGAAAYVAYQYINTRDAPTP